jgi:hypothetical protein
MMVASYNDESGDERIFAVSGLLGMLPEWVELGRRWKQKLTEYRLPEFHAAQCESRREPFGGHERETRDMFQREFYGLIAQSKLWGFCTAIWQKAYSDRFDEFKELRPSPEGHFAHPYFLAFQHNVEAMCLRLEQEKAPRDEPIAFVFDQQKEVEGRAKMLYDSMKYSQGGYLAAYRHRLGSLSFDSRFSQIQLQAADVWAYESRKYVSDILVAKRTDGPRWQFEILRNTGRMQVSGLPADSLDAIVAAMREDLHKR